MLVGEFHDALRQRCRKQHIQAFVRVRQAAQQVANVLDESEVEHAVGFVENGNLNLVEFEHALLEVVDNASRRADQKVDAAFKRLRCFS